MESIDRRTANEAVEWGGRIGSSISLRTGSLLLRRPVLRTVMEQFIAESWWKSSLTQSHIVRYQSPVLAAMIVSCTFWYQEGDRRNDGEHNEPRRVSRSAFAI